VLLSLPRQELGEKLQGLLESREEGAVQHRYLQEGPREGAELGKVRGKIPPAQLLPATDEQLQGDLLVREGSGLQESHELSLGKDRHEKIPEPEALGANGLESLADLLEIPAHETVPHVGAAVFDFQRVKAGDPLAPVQRPPNLGGDRVGAGSDQEGTQV